MAWWARLPHLFRGASRCTSQDRGGVCGRTLLSMREVHWGLVPDMTGTLILGPLVRDDVMKDLVFTGCILRADKGSNLLEPEEGQ